jgi:DNA polymerase-3 subunit delta
MNEILKLTNLAENYDISELTDNCLSKNTNKIIRILNENNYSVEDCILITRNLLTKAKRILKIQIEINKNKKIDEIISTYKPPIFWKDKEIVKKQAKCWSLKNIENLIYKINEIELLIKTNSINSVNIISDFIIGQAKA